MTPATFTAHRAELGLNKADLARRLGISKNTVAAIETGQLDLTEKPIYAHAITGLVLASRLRSYRNAHDRLTKDPEQ